MKRFILLVLCIMVVNKMNGLGFSLGVQSNSETQVQEQQSTSLGISSISQTNVDSSVQPNALGFSVSSKKHDQQKLKSISLGVAIPPYDKESGIFFKKVTAIVSQAFSLSLSLNNLFSRYQQGQNKTHSFTLGMIPSNKSQTISSIMVTTAVSALEKTTFSELQDLLVGSGVSYVSLLNQLWAVYAQRVTQLSGSQKTKTLAQSVAQAPFQEGSSLLSLYTQIVAGVLNFLKMRISVCTSVNFASGDAVYFLNTELPACDALIAQVQKNFDTHFNGTSDDGYPSVAENAGKNAAKLKHNYVSIQSNYMQQKGMLFAQLALTLLQSLATTYSPLVALNGSETTIMGQLFTASATTMIFSCLQKYYAIAQSGLSFMENQNPLPVVGTYQTPQAAFQSLSGWLGSLQVYAGLIGKNNIEQYALKNGQSYQNALASSDTFFPSVQALLNQTQQFYQMAGQCYANQSSIAQSSAYAQISSLISAGISQWKSAEASLTKNAFAQAVGFYQQAATIFKQAGMVQLSSVLSRRADTIMLLYYQMLLGAYVQYYQPAIAQFITQMSRPPIGTVSVEQASHWLSAYPAGFLQLFYYDTGILQQSAIPTFQGISWLSQQALPAFSSLLYAYQINETDLGKQIKLYLAQSLLVLQNMATAAQGMFYNDALSGTSQQLSFEGKAAYANIGSLTVKGAVEGFLQSIHIRQMYEIVDQLLLQGAPSSSQQSNKQSLLGTLPFLGMFSGTALTGFGDFSLLAELYWLSLTIDPCIQTVQQYPEFTSTLVTTALVVATYAKSLVGDPALKGVLDESYVLYLQKKLTNLSANQYNGISGLDLVVTEGNKLLSTSETILDFEAALASFMAAGLQGNNEAQGNYSSALITFSDWYKKQTTLSCPSLYQAFVYYRAFLSEQKGWKISYDAKDMLQKSFKAGAQELIDLLTSIKTAYSKKNFVVAMSKIENLIAVQEALKMMIGRQTSEQFLFGMNSKEFLVMTVGKTLDGQPTVLYGSNLVTGGALPIMIDGQYLMAELSYQQALQQLAFLQKNFIAGSYTQDLQNAYLQMSSLFQKALTYFSQGGFSEMVLKVQQALSQAAAFSYFSSVIPCDSVQKMLTSFCMNQPSITQIFVEQEIKSGFRKKQSLGISVDSSDLNQKKLQPFSLLFHGSSISHSAVTKDPDVVQDPDYLKRYGEQDLTVLAAQEALLKKATAAVQKKLQGVGVAPVKTPTYAMLLSAAEMLLASKESISSSPTDMSLITNLVVPLYERFLVDNNYSSEFFSLQQEVSRYKSQVEKLVTQGIQVGQNLLMTTYALKKIKGSDEKEHVILITQYGPLQAIPRMQGELETALFYYTQYQQFFAQNPTMVQIGGMVYYQIADPQNSQSANAFKNVIGTYLSQYNFYKNVLQSVLLKAPQQVSIEVSKTLNFSAYASAYSLLSSVYTWIFSALNSVEQAQNSEGIYWISASSVIEREYLLYRQFMQNRAQFLVGYPLNPSYKQVLEDIASLAYMATQCTQQPSEQIILLQALGDCYAQAADITTTYAKQIPVQAGFPAVVSSLLPAHSITTTTSYTGCPLPQATSLQAPQDFTIKWYQYYGGAQYYLAALNKYKDAYQITAPGATNAVLVDQKSRTAWGSYILAVIREVAQQIALFGRNAFIAKITPVDDGSEKIAMGFSSQFQSIVQQGQSDGASGAAQGFAALQGGALSNDDTQVQQAQYTIMKKLVLDTLIYCSSAQVQTGQLLQVFGQPSTGGKESLGGQVIKCGVGYYMPGLQMLAAQQQNVGAAYEAGTVGEGQTEDVEVETPVVALPSQEVSLTSLGQTDIEQLVYSNTFTAFIDYCFMALIGSDQGIHPFSLLTQPENISALNDITSQLYSLIQSIYSWAFLPATDQNNPEQLGVDIAAAIKAEEQCMVVNPEAYVG